MKKLGLILATIVLTITGAFAQIQEPVTWGVAAKRLSDTEGVINIEATIKSGWNIYGLNVPDGGPTSTTFKFDLTGGATLNKGVISNPKVKTKNDEIFGMEVPYYTGKVIFQQKVKLKKGQATIVKCTVDYMACDDQQCINPDPYNFKIEIK